MADVFISYKREEADIGTAPAEILTHEDQAWSLVTTMDTQAGYQAFSEIFPYSGHEKEVSYIPKNKNNINLDDLEQRGISAVQLAKFGEVAIYYQQAAVLGHAPSQTKLTFSFFHGLGVPQSDVKAVFWYRQAAEQGEPMSQGNHGLMYELGTGVEQPDEQAVNWYRRSATSGNGFGQLKLAECMRLGEVSHSLMLKQSFGIVERRPKEVRSQSKLYKALELNK